ncbi:MAG: hypothetical protein DWQ04_02950 [Chloroflexi bacterium]|nr:MAG: hypothetical protein DWQ04_02950 [Chloroflexota bacterium]
MDQKKYDSHSIQRWAVLVGVNHYQDNRIRNLRCSVNDALSLHDLLNNSAETGYVPDRVTLLTGEGPEARVTRIDVLSRLMDKAEQANVDDLLLFYFSGHGDVVNGDAYLLPTDAQRRGLLPDTAVSLQRIKSIMQASAARIKVIILDVCHVGATLGQQATSAENQSFINSVVEQTKGIAIFASSSQDDLPWEDANKEHGIFTTYLLEALSGKAKPKNKQTITLKNVVNYVTNKVENWAETHKLEQCPTLKFEFKERDGATVLLNLPEETAPPHAHLMMDTVPIKTNPIHRTFPIAVREVGDFYGRFRELNDIRQIINATTDMPIAILGDRGIGKTSMLIRIEEMLAETAWNGRQFLPFTLPPNGIFTYADFAQTLWDGLYCALLEKGLHNHPLLEKPAAVTSFGRFVAQLNQLTRLMPEMTYVVFIDEFGQIIHQCDDLESNKIEGFLNYVVEKTNIPMVFIMSLLQTLPGSYGSPFPRRPIRLLPFSRQESTELITNLLTGYAPLTEAGQRWVHDYAGGHPFFIKLILAKLFDLFELENTQSAMTTTMLQAAATAACGSGRAGEILRDIYKTYFTEPQRLVVIWMAEQKRPFSWGTLQQAGASIVTATRQLINRHYLLETPDKNIDFKLKFLGDWLRHWAEFPSEVERLLVPEAVHKQVPVVHVQHGQPAEIVSEGVCVDMSMERVYVNGEEVVTALTSLEFKAILYLASRSGEVVSKDELANAIYPEEYYEGDDSRISTLVYRLRNAIGDTKPYHHILTLRKRGYRIQDVTLVGTKNHERHGNGNQVQ